VAAGEDSVLPDDVIVETVYRDRNGRVLKTVRSQARNDANTSTLPSFRQSSSLVDTQTSPMQSDRTHADAAICRPDVLMPLSGMDNVDPETTPVVSEPVVLANKAQATPSESSTASFPAKSTKATVTKQSSTTVSKAMKMPFKKPDQSDAAARSSRINSHGSLASFGKQSTTNMAQEVPKKPKAPPKPSRSAEIMAKLQQSMANDKTKPKRDIKSRVFDKGAFLFGGVSAFLI